MILNDSAVWAGWLLTALLVSACGREGGEQPPDDANAPGRGKNVLLLFTEDHGPHLSALGIPGAQTPNLDALLGQGVYFSNAFVTFASCTGSKSALMTGRHTHAVGVTGNVQEFVGSAESLAVENPPWLTDPNSSYNRNKIREEFQTLVEILHANGYYSGLQNKLHMAPHNKFPFDEWYREDGMPYEQVSDFIKKAKVTGKPWFLQHVVNISHRPYPDGDRVRLDIDPEIVQPPKHLPDSRVARQDWAEYLQSVRDADRRVGEVLDAVFDADEQQNTLIIWLGDHGPAYHRGKLTTYDLGLRVPLVFAGPGVVGAGTIRSEMISGVDILPTLLDYLGIKHPTPELVQGISYRNVLTGIGRYESRSYAVGETAKDRSIYDGRYRLIYMPDPAATMMAADNRDFDPWRNRVYRHIVENREVQGFAIFYRLLDLSDRNLTLFDRPKFELFDTQEDSGEIVDVYGQPEHVQAQQRLLSMLRDWMHQTGDTLPRP